MFGPSVGLESFLAAFGSFEVLDFARCGRRRRFGLRLGAACCADVSWDVSCGVSRRAVLSTGFSGDALEELVSVGCCGFFFGLFRGA